MWGSESWFGEEWAGSTLCVGVLVAGVVGAVALLASYVFWQTPARVPLAIVGGALVAVFLVGYRRCRFSLDQQEYLDMVDHERAELRKYEQALKDAYVDGGCPNHEKIRDTTFCSARRFKRNSEDGKPRRNQPEQEPASKQNSEDGEPPQNQHKQKPASASTERCRRNRFLLETVTVAWSRLEEAERAVNRNNVASFYKSYYYADRQEIRFESFLDPPKTDEETISWALTVSKDDEKIDDHSSKVVVESPRPPTGRYLTSTSAYVSNFADQFLTGGTAEMVRRTLAETGDTGDVSEIDLYTAVKSIQDWNVKQIQKQQKAKRYLSSMALVLGGVLVAAIFLTSYAFVEDLVAIEAFENLSEESRSSFSRSALVMWLLATVGVLGAAFSILFPVEEKFYKVTADPRIPESGIAYEATAARLMVGSLSALLLVGIVLSPLGEGVVNTQLFDDGLAVLLVAFLGGFSERFVTSSLANLERNLAATKPEDAGEKRDDGSGSTD